MGWNRVKSSVLVPHDLTTENNDAVLAALSFVEDPAHVAVLHVVEPLGAFVTLSEDKNRHAREHLEEPLKRLRSLMNDFGQPDVSVHVRFGGAAEEIAGYVREHDVELVVMPSARRSGMSRLLLGSVAESVLRHAPCPVLVLPAQAHD